MGSCLVLIVFSLFTLNYISAKTFFQPTDETVLEIIKHEDEAEGIPDPHYVKCPPAENPVHGRVIGNISREIGAIVHIKCNTGYTLIGEDSILCQAIPSPFEHKAEWFHRVLDTYSTNKPLCIMIIRRKSTDSPDTIKDSRRQSNLFMKSPNEDDENLEDDTPPPPLTSQGRPKSSSDDRVHFPAENKFQSEHTEEQINKEPKQELQVKETETGQESEGVEREEEIDCTLPYKVGPCRASKPRFYYDIKTQSCKQFIYGGCNGNTNNFITHEECEEKCAKTSENSSNTT